MKWNLALLLALLALVFGLAGYVGRARAGGCRVVDGDSLVCDGERIRIYNVSVAEYNEPGGREATENLRAILRSGKVTIHRVGRDRYGRTLAYVFIDGEMVLQRHVGPRAGRGTGR